ncbi:MAG: hypothetical protein QG560_123 [Campylobacterota bacterium]|nr:hypothetical protein [Campylobacterota bacterium]
MARIVKTIEEYIANDRKRDTIFMTFNAPYARASMGMELGEDEKFLDKENTNEQKREEFIAWMKETFPHIHLEDVFDNVPMGYLQWPFLGSVPIDVEIDSPEYHAINSRYEDEEGNPKELDAVVWIMSYEVAKNLHAKKEEMWEGEF